MLNNGQNQTFEGNRINHAGKSNVNVEVNVIMNDNPSNGTSTNEIGAKSRTTAGGDKEVTGNNSARNISGRDTHLSPDTKSHHTLQESAELPPRANLCCAWTPNPNPFHSLASLSSASSSPTLVPEGSQRLPPKSKDDGTADSDIELQDVRQERVVMISTRNAELLSRLLSDPPDFSPNFQVYIRQMLPERYGFPLWLPQPDSSLPSEYCEHGIDVGDVGIITPDGGFDFLFNIWKPAHHPINPRDLPPDFDALTRPDLRVHHQREFFPVNSSVYKGLTTSIDPESEDNASTKRFSYSCVSDEGVILAVPNGASAKDLKNERSLEDFIRKSAESWYRYAIGPADRRISSDSLYLVTGCIKSKTWAIATFGQRLPSPHNTIELVVSRNDPRHNPQCEWTKSSTANTRTAPSYTFSNPRPSKDNQCLFLRGFKIALSKEAWSDVNQEALLTDSLGLKPPNPSAFLNQSSNPFLAHIASSSSTAPSSSNGGASTPNLSSAQTADDNRVTLEKLPPASKVPHPSDIINALLLNEFPRARIALTHDRDWEALFSKSSEAKPIEDLEKLVKSTFQLVFQKDAVVLRLLSNEKTPRFSFLRPPAVNLESKSDPRTMESYEEVDPFAIFMKPPPGETPEERKLRLTQEAKEKAISDNIDQKIQQERINKRKNSKPVKLLVLGQPETGKTTLLKNFQLTFARQEWERERLAWRPVIWWNLMRNVNTILDVIDNEMLEGSSNEMEPGSKAASSSAPPRLKYTNEHRKFRLTLFPLKALQEELERMLKPVDWDSNVTLRQADFEAMKESALAHDLTLASSDGWRSALENLRRARATDGKSLSQGTAEDDVGRVISACKYDIKALWDDPIVQQTLIQKSIRIEESPGFFLSDSERIASYNYQPTNDDILQARLRTVGVQEHKFTLDSHISRDEAHRIKRQEWIFYDVGRLSSRNRPEVYFPFFDDVSSVLFVVSISSFDEYLPEDHRVNRLEASYALWRQVCSNGVLANKQLILILNKCDLLRAKLQQGVLVRKYVLSYGERKNNFETVSRYFKQKFNTVSKTTSLRPRNFHAYLTSFIDIMSTSHILHAVQDSIFRDHLNASQLI